MDVSVCLCPVSKNRSIPFRGYHPNSMLRIPIEDQSKNAADVECLDYGCVDVSIGSEGSIPGQCAMDGLLTQRHCLSSVLS